MCEIVAGMSLAADPRPQRQYRQNGQVDVRSLPWQASPGEVGTLCALLLSRLTSCGSVAANTAGGTEEMGSAPVPGKGAHPSAVGPELGIPGQSSV